MRCYRLFHHSGHGVAHGVHRVQTLAEYRNTDIGHHAFCSLHLARCADECGRIDHICNIHKRHLLLSFTRGYSYELLYAGLQAFAIIFPFFLFLFSFLYDEKDWMAKKVYNKLKLIENGQYHAL